MASFSIHLAVANKYLENFEVEDKMAFFRGVIAPDLTNKKSISHFTENQSKDNAFTYFATKVNLVKYLNASYDESSFQEGYFLHLVTDYLFFNKYFEKDYLENYNTEKFLSDIYNSYDEVNSYVEKKYSVNYYDFYDEISNNINSKKKFINEDDKIKTNLLPEDKIDEFINYVSKIDLKNYRLKLLENGKNIFP
ncbi:MAG: hypothetical protein IJX17_05190 [Clostridia bacterium]|nr:hypothetical protein [Clostridia bacterium]